MHKCYSKHIVRVQRFYPLTRIKRILILKNVFIIIKFFPKIKVEQRDRSLNPTHDLPKE